MCTHGCIHTYSHARTLAYVTAYTPQVIHKSTRACTVPTLAGLCNAAAIDTHVPAYTQQVLHKSTHACTVRPLQDLATQLPSTQGPGRAADRSVGGNNSATKGMQGGNARAVNPARSRSSATLSLQDEFDTAGLPISNAECGRWGPMPDRRTSVRHSYCGVVGEMWEDCLWLFVCVCVCVCVYVCVRTVCDCLFSGELLRGSTVWRFCVGLLCGAFVWGYCLALLCGSTVWPFCVGLQCGAGVWRHCVAL